MATNSKSGLIFVSCGQVADEEKKLGRDVCDLVRELTPHEPYFAENQNSLDALTKNILGSLDNAVALIAIMHPRGTAGGQPWILRFRGSEVGSWRAVTMCPRPLSVAASRAQSETFSSTFAR